ncbi:unnamed protein product [Diamesa tonsa]
MSDSKWYFTAEQLANSPTRKSGMNADQELSYRQRAANLIQEMGQRLQVSQLCINTAIVYMHRFYVFHSFTMFHRNSIAAAAFFLAAKVEEQPRKLEHVIKILNICLEKGDTQKERYAEESQDLVFNENILLQTLGFDVAIDHPHTYVVKACQLFNIVTVSKDLRQTCYFMASNSLHLTTMCLKYRPTVVAAFCIHISCQWAGWEIPESNEGKVWYSYIDKTVTAELLKQLTDEYLQISDRCPSRLKSKMKAISSSDTNIMNAAKTSQQVPQQAGASSVSTNSGYKNLVPTQAPSTTASSTTTSNINPQQRQRTDGRPSVAGPAGGQYPNISKPTIGSLTEENVRSQQRQMHQESVPYLNPVARIDNQTKARVLHPVQRPSSTSSASQQQQQTHPVPVNSKTTGSSGTDNSNFPYQRIPKHPTSTSGVAPNNVDYNRGTTSSSSTSVTAQQQQQPSSQNKVKAWQQQQHSSATQKPPPFNQPTHNSSSSSSSSSNRNNSQPAPPYNDPKSGQPKQQQQQQQQPSDFWFNENSGRSNEPPKLTTPPKQQIKTSSIFSPSPERDTDHSNFKRSGSNTSSGNKSGVPANNWSENKSSTDSPKEKYLNDRRSSTPNKRDSSKRSDVSTTPTSQKSRSDRKPTLAPNVRSENSNILNTSSSTNSTSVFDSSINSNVQQKRPFGAIEVESSDFRDHKIRKLDTKDGSLNNSLMDSKIGIKTNSYDMSFGIKEEHNESLIPLKSTNSKETNPEFVKSLLAETCGVNKFELNSMDSLLTVAGLDCDLLKLEPPEQLLAAQSSLSLFQSQQPAFNTITENTTSSLHTSEDGNNSGQEHHKRSKSKKKKDKHKHKDRSKDKEERKKHKKDKERHKDRDSDRAKDSMSANNSDRSLKIRIPISKELTPVTNVSGMSGSANQLNTSITTQQPLKLKISKNHMENYNTSNPATTNSQPMTEASGYSTSATVATAVAPVAPKLKEKKDKSREKDRRVDKEKDRQRSSMPQQQQQLQQQQQQQHAPQMQNFSNMMFNNNSGFMPHQQQPQQQQQQQHQQQQQQQQQPLNHQLQMGGGVGFNPQMMNQMNQQQLLQQQQQQMQYQNQYGMANNYNNYHQQNNSNYNNMNPNRSANSKGNSVNNK